MSKIKNFEVRVTIKIETGDHFIWDPFKHKHQYSLPYEVISRIDSDGLSFSPETRDEHSSITIDGCKYKQNLKS